MTAIPPDEERNAVWFAVLVQYDARTVLPDDVVAAIEERFPGSDATVVPIATYTAKRLIDVADDICRERESNASAANAAVCDLSPGHGGLHEGFAHGPAAAERPGRHRWLNIARPTTPQESP